MPFECKKYHRYCGAKCCSLVPIPKEIWEAHQDDIQRDVLEEMEGQCDLGDVILPITADLHCPFLKEDLDCAIYADRPHVCRKFGDESHPLMCCPMQHADGIPRKGYQESSANLVQLGSHVQKK